MKMILFSCIFVCTQRVFNIFSVNFYYNKKSIIMIKMYTEWKETGKHNLVLYPKTNTQLTTRGVINLRTYVSVNPYV